MADEKQAAEQQAATEAPATEDVAAAEGGAPAASKKKFMLIIGGVVVLLLLVAGGAAFMLMSGGGGGHEEEPMVLDPAANIVVYDLPPFTVNMLTDGGSEEHYLKAKLALELGSDKEKAETEKMVARLQDDWQNFLRQLRPEDTQGNAAMQRLKEALLLRANQVLSPVIVRDVLFRELLVQ